MAGIRFSDPNPQFFDSNGDPLSGGSLTFYVTETTTQATTYSDADLTTPNTNPVDLDADGRPETDVFLDPSVTYRGILKSAAGATIWDKDPLGGADITAAIAAHNEDADAHQLASESVAGFTEYASQTETNTGTATNRSITPATLAGRTATDARAGVIELATNAEVATGTDTARAVTPAGLAAHEATQRVGSIVGFARTTSTTVVMAQTATIPADNSIPQNTEGTEYFTVSITPKYASSLLRVKVFLPVICVNGDGDGFIGAIFRDSNANAVATAWGVVPGEDFAGMLTMETVVTASAATATTFKFRYGGYTGGGVNIGYVNGAEHFGASKVAIISVEEIAQ